MVGLRMRVGKSKAWKYDRRLPRRTCHLVASLILPPYTTTTLLHSRMGKRKRKSDAAASPALEDENSALDGSENLGPDGMPKVGNCAKKTSTFLQD